MQPAFFVDLKRNTRMLGEKLHLDENSDITIKQDIAHMDEAIKALMTAAEALEGIAD